MIENKRLIINKINTFTLGWSLVQPYSLPISINKNFEEITTSSVVNAITKADKVNIILSEPCLSSRIISELEWVNKYIDINIIAKNENIISRYDGIRFASSVVDSTIDINYLAVLGKEEIFVIISDFYIETDDTINDIYFNGASAKTNYNFLNDAIELYVFSDGEADYSDLLSHSVEKTYYIVSNAIYDKTLISKFIDSNVKLLVTNQVECGVFIKTKDSLLRVSKLKNVYITYPVETFVKSYGALFEPLFLQDVLKGKEIPTSSYSCTNRGIKKVKIEDKKIVEINVNIPLMDDFVSETFDKSIVENHNDYSAEAKEVEYQFTLIPPIFDKSFGKSSIYDELYKMYETISNIQKYDYETFMNECSEITNESDIVKLLYSMNSSWKRFKLVFQKYDFTHFYFISGLLFDDIEKLHNNYLECLTDIYNKISNETSLVKFDKFDNEIKGYRLTILEKKVLIEQNIDVLSNKRRIEILNKKINDLLALKQKFESTSSQRNDKGSSEFKSYCKEVIKGTFVKHSTSEESIGNVIKQNQNDKMIKLYSFVEKELKGFDKYIKNLYDELSKIVKIDIPNEYTVYDKDGKHYIVIDNLNEYDKTKELREKYNLECITRRN